MQFYRYAKSLFEKKEMLVSNFQSDDFNQRMILFFVKFYCFKIIKNFKINFYLPL